MRCLWDAAAHDCECIGFRFGYEVQYLHELAADEHTSRWRVAARWEVANELGAGGPDRPDEGTFAKFARRERGEWY